MTQALYAHMNNKTIKKNNNNNSWLLSLLRGFVKITQINKAQGSVSCILTILTHHCWKLETQTVTK
jgi:hypothetical protein